MFKVTAFISFLLNTTETVLAIAMFPCDTYTADIYLLMGMKEINTSTNTETLIKSNIFQQKHQFNVKMIHNKDDAVTTQAAWKSIQFQFMSNIVYYSFLLFQVFNMIIAWAKNVSFLLLEMFKTEVAG